VVGLVGAVTGHRTRYRLMKEWFVSDMAEALASTTHDVQLILDYLAKRGDFDMEHVALFGTGSGGAVAILASAADERIKVLDVLAPWGDWPNWLKETKIVTDEERAKYLTPEFLEQVAPLDPANWLGKIRATQVRIVDIRGNKAMPDKAQESLEAAAPERALLDEYGNGRAFLAQQPSLAVLDWVKFQMKTDSQPQIAMDKSTRIHFYPAIQLPDKNAPNVAQPQMTKIPAPAKDNEKPRENPR